MSSQFSSFRVNEPSTQCPICNKYFSNPSNANRHLDLAHNSRLWHDTDTDDYDMTNDVPAVESFNDMVELEDGSSYFDDNDNHDNYDVFEENDLVDSASQPHEEPAHTSTFHANPFYPFKNEMELKCLMFFKGSQDRFSQRIVKKTLRLIRSLIEISHKERDVIQNRPQGFDPIKNVLSDDRICKSHSERRKFPRLEVDTFAVPKGDGSTVDLTYIKPSNHLRLLMANPTKVSLLNSLPDFSPNKRNTLNQGLKWKECPLFQSPMVPKELSRNFNDFWLGDVVINSSGSTHIISKFFTFEGQIFIEAYAIELDHNTFLAILTSEKNTMSISSVSFVLSLLELIDMYLRASMNIVSNTDQVVRTHSRQLNGFHQGFINHCLSERDKVPIDPSTRRHMKVRIVPISLFSDDTSGNRSKKWNCFDTWTMNISALPLKISNEYENHFFICTSNHKITAMEMIEPLTNDLYNLEKGMVMYDSQFKQNVFVISPVLFIRGDNVRQAEIALHKGSRATHPCRFCYWQSDPSKPVDANGQPLSLHYSASGFSAPSRTLQDYKDFATLQYQQRPEPVFLPNRGRPRARIAFESDWSKLGFKFTGGEHFLNLDAIDLSKDLPVEILHTLLLGMTKYCFIIFYDHFMDNNHIESLTDLFRNYNSKALHRNLTSSLKNFRSFVGRDYKIMVQLLPSLLQRSRLDNPRLYPSQTVFESLFNCFNTLGSLSSLIYMEKIDNFEQYKNMLVVLVTETIAAMDNL
ncbi:hypothetical protein INT47_012525 [Mucor saturninus]|uniref:C2H2-type domain-containing protein n=1 Tax=Mucor saturninus TaxID=64648 RepID=A0A8H7R3I9_9FUNG|nr:hypothetical protein INT47_012525 [Mucor saturninus]